MVDCLADQSVDARLKDFDDAENQAEVWPADQVGPWRLCDDEGCAMGGTEGISETALASIVGQFEAMAAARDTANPNDGPSSGSKLFVGERDLTETWIRCAEDTGYVTPVYANDPNEELVDKQRIAQAGAAWAECARSHGFPTTKDPQAPVADDWTTEPTAVLPASVTEIELRALLDECPTFDRAARMDGDLRLAKDPGLSEEEYEEMKGTEALIGFDVPCQDGSATECDDATWAKYNPLVLVIEEQTNEYLRELNRRTSGAIN
jgi:hypothetical protein